MVCAELIEVYPPGIPILSEGFEIMADAIAYLRHAAGAGARIVARDPALDTVRVVEHGDLAEPPRRDERSLRAEHEVFLCAAA